MTLAGGLRELGLRDLAQRAAALADGMSFRFLLDPQRRILSIGYRLADADGPGRLDGGYYDLLASEARIASFLAIAKGDAPEAHWFRLGRLVVSVEGVPTLVSWSASMFEYLMPLLLMRTWPGTLLDSSCRAVVRRQADYGRDREVPWGISESAYRAERRWSCSGRPIRWRCSGRTWPSGASRTCPPRTGSSTGSRSHRGRTR